jgi:hypothetical protein
MLHHYLDFSTDAAVFTKEPSSSHVHPRDPQALPFSAGSSTLHRGHQRDLITLLDHVIPLDPLGSRGD